MSLDLRRDVVRFLIGPIFVIIALNVWPKYMRAKIVNAVDNCITFLAQAFLLVSRLLYVCRRGTPLFTARAYARAVLGVVILSVRQSVRLSICLSHAWIVTKLNDALQIFLYHTKGQSLCYSDTKSGWSATPSSL